MQHDLPPGLVLITIPQFMTKLGITSEPHFHSLRKKDPRFPRALRRGKRWSRYVLSEVDQYIGLLVAERDKVAA